MNIGVVGLGKVGLVLAQVLRYHGGHDVVGYDIQTSQEVLERLANFPEPIAGVELTLAADMRTLVLGSDVVFICVPTPNKDFDATNPHSIQAEDFDYQYLDEACAAVSQEASKQAKHITLVVVCTVSPGTFAERLYDIIDSRYVALVYSPSFISLGTIERDMLKPQAILIGADELPSYEVVSDVWVPITNAERIKVSIESAEIIKMASNIMQLFKIQYINALAALAEKTLADMDQVSSGLERVLNHGWIPRAGMPDGGACRPRDIAAMTEVAHHHKLYTVENLFAAIGDQRLDQMDRIVGDLKFIQGRFPGTLPIVIMGDGYKPGVTYTDGSPGVLLHRMLSQHGTSTTLLPSGTFDKDTKFGAEAIYVIAVPFEFKLSNFHEGSVVYDVWGYAEPDSDVEVTYITPGRIYGGVFGG